LSEIEVNAEDLQSVVLELQTENSNLKLMKSALLRKIKEQADEIDDLSTKPVVESPSEVPEGIDLTELKFDS
jgi:hypothetical protein